MTTNKAIHLVAPATTDARAVSDASSLNSTTAFEAEVHPHLRWLQQWACRLTHDTEAAFDLVQDTLERGYQKRALFQPGTNVRAWLLRIMRNIWISKHRRVGASTSLISLDEVDEVTSTVATHTTVLKCHRSKQASSIRWVKRRSWG